MFDSTAHLANIELIQTVRSFIDRAFENPIVTIVELLLIGTVVYTVLRFLQGTRGARLIRAVFIILAVSFALVWLIAERFGFERINVLYPYFLLAIFLVSLVAFQTELRRLLLRLGEGGWLQHWIKEHTSTVDPVVTAVERLAKRKVGALIAIERTTEIGAVTDSGVRLDARVSSELLETIFHPGTPLHDLGVIIRGDVILAACCQFPLAESGELDRSLGSRHRAGLGMSHEADAIVIIVSEETGGISLAVRGRMERSISTERLRSRLVKELSGEPPNAEAEEVQPEQQDPARTDEQAKAEDVPIRKVAADGTGQVV
ncbi:MAG: diadenylate cyclase CdaA [Planctomycetota bacterium]